MDETVHILLIEDDDVAAEGIHRALGKAKIDNPVHRARDGIEGLERLRGSNGSERIPRPYVILLDLRMPRMDGLQFLEELRGDPNLADSVVFVLTTSDAEKDRAAAYRQFVAGYIVKARVREDFTDLIGMFDYYWRIVKLPEVSNP